MFDLHIFTFSFLYCFICFEELERKSCRFTCTEIIVSFLIGPHQGEFPRFLAAPSLNDGDSDSEGDSRPQNWSSELGHLLLHLMSNLNDTHATPRSDEQKHILPPTGLGNAKTQKYSSAAAMQSVGYFVSLEREIKN